MTYEFSQILIITYD